MAVEKKVEVAVEKKKKKATAKNLIKSKESYVVEITIKRGDEKLVLPLKPLTAEEHSAIYDKKPPRPPTMLLPKIRDGHIMEGEDRVWRYMEEIDLNHPTLPEADRNRWEEYQTKLSAYNKEANQGLVFAVLPDDIKAEFDEKYKQRTPPNIDKFLNDIFLVGELYSLYSEIYQRVSNAMGVEYGPFSGLDFLKNLGIGNLPDQG